MAFAPNCKEDMVYQMALSQYENSPTQDKFTHQIPTLVPPLAAFHPFGPMPLFLPYMGSLKTTPLCATEERMDGINRFSGHGVSSEATHAQVRHGIGKDKHGEDKDGQFNLDVIEKSDKEMHKKRSKNWTRRETLSLIRLRIELEAWFSRVGRKTELWDQISLGLRKDKFRRDGQQCRDKWEKLMAGYKEVRDGLKEREDNPFYDILHPMMLSRRVSRSSEIKTDIDANETMRISVNNKKLALSSACAIKEVEKEEHPPLIFNGHLDQDYIDDTGVMKDGTLHKRKRCQKYVTVSDLRAIRTIFETLISQQQKMVKDFLVTLEQKERQRELVRQEREQEWRAEEHAQSQVLNNVMLLLTQRLVKERISGESFGAQIINNHSTHQGPLPKIWKSATH